MSAKITTLRSWGPREAHSSNGGYGPTCDWGGCDDYTEAVVLVDGQWISMCAPHGIEQLGGRALLQDDLEPRLECVADVSPSKPALVSAAVQWAPSGNPLDGTPAEVVRLLAADDGRTFGYGYGPGRSMIFRHEHGEVSLLPRQWIARNQDSAFTVTDTDPNAPKEPA
jgi:hypothetical protein